MGLNENGIHLLHGDSNCVLDTIDTNSVDAVVTDVPAGISLLGNQWDNPAALENTASSNVIGYARNPLCKKCGKFKRGWRGRNGCLCEVPNFDANDRQTVDRDKFIAWLENIMAKCLRVVKPGGYALVWSIPKTSHWTAKALENAGWQLCGSIAHVFSQGLPKSFNIALAIERSLSKDSAPEEIDMEGSDDKVVLSDEAKKWVGWGTSLKPAYERWILARKQGNDKPERKPPAFFYCSKTSKAEKNNGKVINDHPTIKSLKLMSFLIKSVADAGDIILDPFAGSGSTGVACAMNGYQFIGIEKEEKYFNIAKSRIDAVSSEITMDCF